MATARRTLKVAVVGAGSIGREFALHHFGRDRSGTQVSSIVDVDAAAARALAEDVAAAQAGAAIRVGSSRYRSSVDRTGGAAPPLLHATKLTQPILDDCDIVYIGTTPSSHKDLVQQALDSGKHVLLEKPLASTAADADAIVAAAESAERRGLFVGMNIGMRYNEAVVQMRRLLEQEDSLEAAALRLHFVQWPREWQQVAWCAERASGVYPHHPAVCFTHSSHTTHTKHAPTTYQ